MFCPIGLPHREQVFDQFHTISMVPVLYIHRNIKQSEISIFQHAQTTGNNLIPQQKRCAKMKWVQAVKHSPVYMCLFSTDSIELALLK